MAKRQRRTIFISCLIFLFACLFACLSLYGCTGGGTVVGNPSLDFEISGAAQKGPFVVNSKVEIQPLAPNGEYEGQTIVTETINSIGDFEFQTNNETAMQITAEGYHINELTGKLSAGMLTLKAIYANDGESKQRAFVNVLTHLIHKRVLYLMQESKILASQAIDQAESEFLSSFEAVIDQTVNINMFTHLSVFNVDGTEPEGNAYLLLTSAALYQHATSQSIANGSSVDAELTAVLNTLCVDLQPDGILDQADLLQAIKLSLTELDRDAIEENLKTQSATALGAPLNIPSIERYMNQILIVYPAEGAEINDPTDIRLALPSGLTEIAYTLLIDGEEVDVVDEAPYQFSWNPYYWSASEKHTLLVQAEDASGNAVNSNLITISIPATAKAALVLESPEEGEIFQDANQSLLVWQVLEDTTAYDVQVATEANFQQGQIVFEITLAENSLLTPILDEGAYLWRIKATNAIGKKGAWSSARSFEIRAPNAPLSTESSILFSNAAFQVKLNWGSVLHAQEYLLEIAANQDFTESLATHLLTETTHIFTATTPRYYWRVKATNSVGLKSNWASGEVNIAAPIKPIPESVSTLSA